MHTLYYYNLSGMLYFKIIYDILEMIKYKKKS